LVEQTLELSQAEETEWRHHCDALDNLRILNKHHTAVFLAKLDVFESFIRVQVESLRSNNSKNGLSLVEEMFAGKDKKCFEPFVAKCMPSVLLKCAADKAFITKLAKKGVSNASQSCATEALALVLVE